MFTLKNQGILFQIPTLISIILLMFCYTSSAQEKVKHETTGFVDFNGYYDTRDYSVLTINILANLPNRIQYFSLTNYEGRKKSSDLSTHYAEHNIRWTLRKKSPLQLTYQYVTRSGNANDDHRLGIKWNLHKASKLKKFFKKLNMSYSLNPMFFQFRESFPVKYMTIIEHVYKINFFSKKLYIDGFADQNFIKKEGKYYTEWVTEHQLGIKLIDQLFFVTEFRINTFLPSENIGLGYGIEYKAVF